jgi:hypothetical protein
MDPDSRQSIDSALAEVEDTTAILEQFRPKNLLSWGKSYAAESSEALIGVAGGSVGALFLGVLALLAAESLHAPTLVLLTLFTFLGFAIGASTSIQNWRRRPSARIDSALRSLELEGQLQLRRIRSLPRNTPTEIRQREWEYYGAS